MGKVWKCLFNKTKKYSILIILFIGNCFYASGQFYNGSQLSFGKNRVQHQKFNWLYYRTDQYDVYYYPTGKALAEYTTWKAAQYIEEIETFLNFSSSKKLQFIVYNTQSDFRESNFAYDDAEFYNQGGITNVYGTKIYLYFDGNHQHLDQMIRSGIMNIYAHLIVEGESMGANISSEHLFSVPDWYYIGLASYIGNEWNSELDAYVKNGILTGRYPDFDELSPLDSRYAGHSFWKFIADKYGKHVIPSILYATRAYRNFEPGFSSVLGVDYKTLQVNWYRHFFVLYKKENKRSRPTGESALAKYKNRRTYSQFRFSPDGNSFAYVTNEAGQIKIWLKTEEMKKPRMVFRRYQKTEDNPDQTFPLLAWHPSGKILGFTLEDKGRCYYYPYDVTEKKTGERRLIDLEKITDISFSEDGKLMVFTGFKNGQSDIFVYSFIARSIQQITNDFYDDATPRFSEDGRYIFFSSKRPHDSLALSSPKPFYQTEIQSAYDLFRYDYKQKENQLFRITHTPDANETGIRMISPNEIIFLSDENGINNRYYALLDSAISYIDTAIHYRYTATIKPLTDNIFNIQEQDYNASKGVTAEIVLHDGTQHLYISPFNASPLSTSIAPSSIKMKMQLETARKDSIQKVRLQEKPIQRGFYQVRQSDIIRASSDSISLSTPNGPASYDALTNGLSFTRQVARNYYVQYSINKLITQADFSFLNTSYQQFTGGTNPIYLNAGLNALIMVGVNDLFENHRITGGFRISFDLDNTEFMFSYENLSRRVDQQIVLYRQTLKSTIQDYLYKQYSNSVFYITKYPFNKFNSIRLTLTGRYDKNVMAGLNDYSLKAADVSHYWGGVKVEYIFDSSKELYTNLWKGSKIKLFAEYLHRIDNENKNLFVVGFDARKSVKIYRNMTWATRLSGSTNVGSNRLVYYMGGVDNWMFAKFNSDIWVDITKDYAYQTLATNMRGFEQNIRNGTSFILLSTELRIPFVQLIAQKKVGNNFLNSLQLILFGDFGTAWTGLTPYSEDNCLYTRYIYWGPNEVNSIKIKRQVEPFVAGFGAGLRASFFGYFLRLDYAWGVEDYKIYQKKGMLLFSIGLDF